MTRTLTSGVQTAVASESAEFVHLLEFSFSTGPVRLCTGAHDLLWNSVTWEAVGGLLEFGGVEETADAKGQGVDVRLSGVDQSILVILMGSHYRGRDVKIWRAHLNRTTGAVIADPILLFKGLQLNPYTVDEDIDRDGGTVRISTRLSGYFGATRAKGIVTNLTSHQHFYAGDMFFQHTPSLANLKVYWGTDAPITPGTTSGSGGDERAGTGGDWEFR